MREASEHRLDAVLAAAGDDAVEVDAERLGELRGAVDQVELVEHCDVEPGPAPHVPHRPPPADASEPPYSSPLPFTQSKHRQHWHVKSALVRPGCYYETTGAVHSMRTQRIVTASD